MVHTVVKVGLSEMPYEQQQCAREVWVNTAERLEKICSSNTAEHKNVHNKVGLNRPPCVIL